MCLRYVCFGTGFHHQVSNLISRPSTIQAGSSFGESFYFSSIVICNTPGQEVNELSISIHFNQEMRVPPECLNTLFSVAFGTVLESSMWLAKRVVMF